MIVISSRLRCFLVRGSFLSFVRDFCGHRVRMGNENKDEKALVFVWKQINSWQPEKDRTQTRKEARYDSEVGFRFRAITWYPRIRPRKGNHDLGTYHIERWQDAFSVCFVNEVLTKSNSKPYEDNHKRKDLLPATLGHRSRSLRRLRTARPCSKMPQVKIDSNFRAHRQFRPE